jgi:tetratricopeptide (TPR) repeat protein
MTMILANCRNKLTCSEVSKQYFKILKDTNNIKENKAAIHNLEDLLENAPRCTEALLLLGDFCLHDKQFEKAKKMFNLAILLQSDNGYPYYKMGLLFDKTGLLDSAVIYLNTAEHLKNQNGYILDFKGEFQNGGHDVLYKDIIYNRAIVNFERKDFLSAMNDLNYCINEKHEVGSTFLLRGLIYEKIDEKIKACKDFKLAKINGNIEADYYIQKYSCPDSIVNYNLRF